MYVFPVPSSLSLFSSLLFYPTPLPIFLHLSPLLSFFHFLLFLFLFLHPSPGYEEGYCRASRHNCGEQSRWRPPPSCSEDQEWICQCPQADQNQISTLGAKGEGMKRWGDEGCVFTVSKDILDPLSVPSPLFGGRGKRQPRTQTKYFMCTPQLYWKNRVQTLSLGKLQPVEWLMVVSNCRHYQLLKAYVLMRMHICCRL